MFSLKYTLNIKTQKSESEEMRKIYQANANQKKAGVAVLILNKTNLRIRKSFRAKDGHYIMIKESSLQEDIVILSAFVLSNSVKTHKARPDRTARKKTDEFTIAV
jgi:hypothetical protein